MKSICARCGKPVWNWVHSPDHPTVQSEPSVHYFVAPEPDGGVKHPYLVPKIVVENIEDAPIEYSGKKFARDLAILFVLWVIGTSVIHVFDWILNS